MYKNLLKFVVGKTRLNINTCIIITAVALLASSCTPPKTVRYTKKHKNIGKQISQNKQSPKNYNTREIDKLKDFENLLVESKKTNSPKNVPVETQYEEIKTGDNTQQEERVLPTLREQVAAMKKKHGSINSRFKNMETDIKQLKHTVNDIKMAIIKMNRDKNYTQTQTKTSNLAASTKPINKKQNKSTLLPKEKTKIISTGLNKTINNTSTIVTDDFTLGENNFKKKNYDEALPFLTKVIRKDRNGKNAGKAHYYLGKINYEKKNYNQAVSHLKRSLTIKGTGYKDNAQALLAEAYIRSGSTDLAIAAYKSLINNYPSSKYIPKARKMLQQL